MLAVRSRPSVARLGWNIADQAVSSLANAGLSILVAREVGSHAYGAFGLGFATYTLVVGMSQALWTQPLLIRFSASDRNAREVAAGQVATLAASTGVGVAAVVACVAAVVSGDLVAVLLVLAVFLPGLLLQDAVRSIFNMLGNPRGMFINDLIWTSLQIVGFGSLIYLHRATLLLLMLAWGISALVAATAGLTMSRTAPSSIRVGWAFARESSKASRPLVLQWFAILGASQLVVVLIAAIAGVGAAGSLRGGQTLLGPLNIIGLGVTAFAIPDLVRRRADARAVGVRAAAMIAGVLVGVDAFWGAALLLTPRTVGHQILGASWTNARGALPGLIVFACANAATVGPSCVFRAQNRTHLIFRLSLIMGPALVLFSTAGAEWHGASGATWGMAAAAVLTVPFSWRYLFQHHDAVLADTSNVASLLARDIG